MKVTEGVRSGMYNFALAATFAVALGVATTAHAAFWDWKGKTSGTSYFDDTSCWYKSGSTAFADSNHNISTERGHLNLVLTAKSRGTVMVVR